MLSIADCLLAVLWTVGGTLWLYNGVTTSEESQRVGCFTVLLMTVVSFVQSQLCVHVVVISSMGSPVQWVM